MAEDDIPTIDIPDLQFVDAPGQVPVGKTIHRMVDVLRSGKAPDRPKADVSAAFDRGFKGVDLNLGDEPTPIFPKNPVPIGSGKKSAKGQAYRPSGRPAGAEDLQGLFATGLILLLVFAVGDWATPTADEALAISAPLANIVARRIDLAAKLGRDASDTIALAVAILSYLARVGPLAAERVRENLARRQQRERVIREPSYGPPDSGGTGGMDAGSANGAGSGIGAAYHPIDALAKAQRNGLGVLERDLGVPQGQDPSVGDRG